MLCLSASKVSTREPYGLERISYSKEPCGMRMVDFRKNESVAECLLEDSVQARTCCPYVFCEKLTETLVHEVFVGRDWV